MVSELPVEQYFTPPDKRRIAAVTEESSGGRISDILTASTGLSPTEQAIAAHMVSLRRGSPGTVRVYLPTLLAFFRFAETPVTHIRVWHIEDWLNSLEQAAYKPATIATKLACIKSFFGYLWKCGLLPLNPAAPVKGPKHIEGHHGDRVLLADEVQELLEHTRRHAPARDHLMCRLLFAAGARAAEAVSLRWGDLRRDVRGRWYATVMGKGRKTRHLHIPKDLAADLLVWKGVLYSIEPYQPAPGLDAVPLFPNRRVLTQPITVKTAYRIVTRWGEAALGRKISPHWLRHTFATHSRLAGATLEQIRVALGHESIQTTIRYEHSPHLTEPAGEILEKNGIGISSVSSD